MGFLFGEEITGVLRQFEQPDSIVHIGMFGICMPLDLAQEPHLLRFPYLRRAIMEGRVDPPVELIEIHGVQPVFQPLIFALAALDDIRESTQQNAAQAGQRLTEKNLNIQPTITIRPGWPLKIIIQKDIVLRPYKG